MDGSQKRFMYVAKLGRKERGSIQTRVLLMVSPRVWGHSNPITVMYRGMVGHSQLSRALTTFEKLLSYSGT